MTVVEAEALAAQIHTALTLMAVPRGHADHDRLAADHERVASDLAGLRACEDALSRMLDRPSAWSQDIGAMEQAAHRFADGLRRTAALYDIEVER